MESPFSKSQMIRLRSKVNATANGTKRNSSRSGKIKVRIRRGRRRMWVKAWGRRAFLLRRTKGEVSPAESEKNAQDMIPHFTRLR